MSIYHVLLGEDAHTKRVRGYVVSANDATEAKNLCKAQIGGDAGDGAWDGATVTTYTEVAASASACCLGWRFQIIVRDTAGAIVANVTQTGTGTDDLDDMGTDLATLLNATASIANAGYTVGTQTLVVASGAGGDDLGDHSVEFYAYPPVATDTQGVQTSQDVNVDAFTSSITHEGVATDALTIVFNADTILVPTVLSTIEL